MKKSSRRAGYFLHPPYIWALKIIDSREDRAKRHHRPQDSPPQGRDSAIGNLCSLIFIPPPLTMINALCRYKTSFERRFSCFHSQEASCMPCGVQRGAAPTRGHPRGRARDVKNHLDLHCRLGFSILKNADLHCHLGFSDSKNAKRHCHSGFPDLKNAKRHCHLDFPDSKNAKLHCHSGFSDLKSADLHCHSSFPDLRGADLHCHSAFFGLITRKRFQNQEQSSHSTITYTYKQQT